MSEASFASLNPTLLARKGGAKPAMRPQLHSLPEASEASAVDAEQLEDLGWNDMGAEAEGQDSRGAEVLHLTPAAANEAFEEDLEDAIGLVEDDVAAEAQDKAPVETDNVTAIEPVSDIAAPVPAKQASTQHNARRAAFTLRLDTDRHMKLRLAATMQGKSAQAFVTEALDQMLDQIEDLDALAERMQRN